MLKLSCLLLLPVTLLAPSAGENCWCDQDMERLEREIKELYAKDRQGKHTSSEL